MTRDVVYGPAILTVREGPFAGEMIKASNVLCADGQRRNAFPSHDGISSEINRIPAYVYARGQRVYGVIELIWTSSRDAEPVDITFAAHPFRRNARLIN